MTAARYHWLAPLTGLLLALPCLAQGYRYDLPLILEGRLVQALAPASITADERPHRYPALLLAAPISTVCTTEDDQFCEAEKSVSQVQLALANKAQWRQFEQLRGKPVRVSGMLFHSDNGNHYTKVLLDVKAINP